MDPFSNWSTVFSQFEVESQGISCLLWSHLGWEEQGYDRSRKMVLPICLQDPRGRENSALILLCFSCKTPKARDCLRTAFSTERLWILGPVFSYHKNQNIQSSAVGIFLVPLLSPLCSLLINSSYVLLSWAPVCVLMRYQLGHSFPTRHDGGEP